MVHDHSRYPPFAAYDDGYLGMKFGDTYRVAHFDQPSIKNQSPVAGRYGGTIHASVRAECFITGYATRAVRVATELTANWTAAESLENSFVHSPDLTGEEGFYGKGSLADAEKALAAMYNTLLTADVYQTIFGIGDSTVCVDHGICTAADGWRFDDEDEE